MTVTFTANLGLAKPDVAEIARTWADLTELQEDNFNVYTAALPVVTNYTVSMVSDATPPSIGSGANALELGKYVVLPGDVVMGWFVFRFNDPGVSAGTGNAYAVNLPFPCDGTFHSEGVSFTGTSAANDVIGEAFIRDQSSATLSQTCALDLIQVAGIAYARFLTEGFTGKTTRFFTPTQPFALATDDRVSGNFLYKAVIP